MAINPTERKIPPKLAIGIIEDERSCRLIAFGVHPAKGVTVWFERGEGYLENRLRLTEGLLELIDVIKQLPQDD